MNNENFIPINSTAARVISKGIHYVPKIKDKRFNSENPIPTIKKQDFNNSSQFKDFTGNKHGRFIIQGLVDVKNLAKGKNFRAKWLVKCSCGNYETRTSSAIKNHANNPGKYDEDMCKNCEDLKKIQRMASAKSMGYSYKEYCQKFYPRNSCPLEEKK
ncbi:MAG: hypothetical protein AABY22_27400, partial [Nanoarchaeota archaeon]